MGNPAAFPRNPLRDPAEGSLRSSHHVSSPDFKAGLRPVVLGVRVVFRVFFLSNFPSFFTAIFFRKEAIKKKNLLHFQFPSPRFPHGCDVEEASFRNAQVTHAGTPRGGTQEFLRAGRGQPRAPSAGRPRATRASRDWKVPRKSPVAGDTHTTERQKKGTAQSAAFAPEECHGL